MTSSRRAIRTAATPCAILWAIGLAAAPAVALAQSPAPPAAQLPPDVNPQSRSRLAPRERDSLDAQGREFYDALARDSRRLTGVGGPSGIRMYSPQAGEWARRLTNYLRFESALGARTVELAILVTARELDSQFEWSAHEPVALKAGVSKELVDALKRRASIADVPGVSEQDAAIIELGREVFSTHKVGAATYARALKALGAKNLVDLTMLIGEYSSTAILLATFDQQLAAGERPPLPPLPALGAGGPPAAHAGPREDAMKVVDAWAKAFSDSDIEAMVSLYAPDALFVGTGSRAVVTDPAGVRAYFEKGFLADRPRTARVYDTSVALLSDTSVLVTGLDTISSTRDGKTVSRNGRVTFVVARRGTDWKIVHFHRSNAPN